MSYLKMTINGEIIEESGEAEQPSGQREADRNEDSALPELQIIEAENNSLEKPISPEVIEGALKIVEKTRQKIGASKDNSIN